MKTDLHGALEMLEALEGAFQKGRRQMAARVIRYARNERAKERREGKESDDRIWEAIHNHRSRILGKLIKHVKLEASNAN
jgi:hypothetical protein